MRILLDEDIPRRLGSLLIGHKAETVARCGWAGIKNGRLLALAGSKFDVFLNMDQNIEFQQDLTTLPIAILVIVAISNRIEHLRPFVPEILKELNHIPPKTLRGRGLPTARPGGRDPGNRSRAAFPRFPRAVCG